MPSLPQTWALHRDDRSHHEVSDSFIYISLSFAVRCQTYGTSSGFQSSLNLGTEAGVLWTHITVRGLKGLISQWGITALPLQRCFSSRAVEWQFCCSVGFSEACGLSVISQITKRNSPMETWVWPTACLCQGCFKRVPTGPQGAARIKGSWKAMWGWSVAPVPRAIRNILKPSGECVPWVPNRQLISPAISSLSLAPVASRLPLSPQMGRFPELSDFLLPKLTGTLILEEGPAFLPPTSLPGSWLSLAIATALSGSISTAWLRPPFPGGPGGSGLPYLAC